MSRALQVGEKGLVNKKGENNCFLNVVIQSLWHLKPFRERFEKFVEENPTASAKSHILESLCLIFTQYRYGEEEALPPDALRSSLASAYASSSKFQLGELDDASEAHEAILRDLHGVMSGSSDPDSCSPTCPVHKTFGLTFLEQVSCPKCHASSEPLTYSSYIHYLSATELKAKHATGLSFTQSVAAMSDELKSCPAEPECGATNCPSQLTVFTSPTILTFGFSWDSDRASRSEVGNFIDSLDLRINIKEAFSGADDREYILRGMVMFYGKHYNAYFFNDQVGSWFVFDDAAVIEIGFTWLDVRSRCMAGHLQPLMLFYEDASLTAIHPDTVGGGSATSGSAPPPAYTATPATDGDSISSPTQNRFRDSPTTRSPTGAVRNPAVRTSSLDEFVVVEPAGSSPYHNNGRTQPRGNDTMVAPPRDASARAPAPSSPTVRNTELYGDPRTTAQPTAPVTTTTYTTYTTSNSAYGAHVGGGTPTGRGGGRRIGTTASPRAYGGPAGTPVGGNTFSPGPQTVYPTFGGGMGGGMGGPPQVVHRPPPPPYGANHYVNPFDTNPQPRYDANGRRYQ